MRCANSSARTKLLGLRSARWFPSFIKIFAGAALLVIAAYISFCLTATVIGSRSFEEPLLWFPDRANTKENFYAERTFHKPYKYLINQENVCPTGVPIDYLFVVYSAAANPHARSVIRNTWGKEVMAFAGNRLIFMFGKPETAKLQDDLKSESLRHGDIIEEDFSDSYRNLTLKTVMMLRWVTVHCPQARFLVKIDDDTFPNLGNFYRAMHGQTEDAIYGNVYHMQKPSRDPLDKWYIPYDELPVDIQPDFVTGGMYVIGSRVVDLLYRATGHVKPFRMEDVYLTGMCAERAGVARIHLVGSRHLKWSSLCDYKKAIYGHHVTADEMNELWYAMKRLEYKCRWVMYTVHVCYCATVNSEVVKEIGNAVF